MGTCMTIQIEIVIGLPENKGIRMIRNVHTSTVTQSLYIQLARGDVQPLFLFPT